MIYWIPIVAVAGAVDMIVVVAAAVVVHSVQVGI